MHKERFIVEAPLELNDRQFDLFRDWISRHTGISVRDSKAPMLSSRIARRMRARSLNDFDRYYQLLLDEGITGTEHRELVNCITTNHTSFFRERHHFDFLTKLYKDACVKHASDTFDVWSAACSTGEEPYSIAMTLKEAAAAKDSHHKARILASDLDTGVLRTAEAGIYPADALAPVPEKYVQKFFLKGSGSQKGRIRLKHSLREDVTFRQLNFIDPNWNVDRTFDVIFCRNALIYFPQSSQDQILRRLIASLKPGGHLIVGHSEHLHWLTDLLQSVGTTIYRLKPRS